jgi:hypothetical protein
VKGLSIQRPIPAVFMRGGTSGADDRNEVRASHAQGHSTGRRDLNAFGKVQTSSLTRWVREPSPGSGNALPLHRRDGYQ